MATFTYTPSYSTQVEYKPRILEAKFGDGYEQGIENGINANPRSWSLTFNGVDLTTATNILNFFSGNKTHITSFDWTPPDGVSGKFKCKTWRRSYDGSGHATITCTFDEVFW